MIAYVRMQLLRWMRRTFGIGLLITVGFVPTFLCLLFLFTVQGSLATRQATFVFFGAFFVILGSAFSLPNQLANLVEEEARLKRSTLLRVGSLDGFRAVAAFSVLGLVLALLHGILGFAGPALVGLFLKIPVGQWLIPSAATILLLSAFGPPAIMGGFLFPRTLGLLLVNTGALVGGLAAALNVPATPKELSATLFITVLAIHAAGLVGGGLLWRAKSTSLW